ncbi:hypothetical protein AQPE_4480 [Aquipluma nitroreducens]|uniref:Uncharacterized protein n=1 Tax=Aquipluma nitroreducens TaxID=2010828 RepID=A0A5K7SFN8_9BACT|nr:hypothetical protein AQPE_4480 [Aquipluma nitroreducens]
MSKSRLILIISEIFSIEAFITSQFVSCSCENDIGKPFDCFDSLSLFWKQLKLSI